MPNDNEVDETQHWGDLMRELRSKVPEGLAPLVDRLSFACDQRLSFLLHERYEQDLSHAATVAELRAEVERLRAERQASLGVGDGSGQLIVHGKYDSIKECQRKLLAGEAAERRVRELEADARRYRYLRDNANPDSDEGFAVMRDEMNEWGKWCAVHVTGDALDAAIDALNLEPPTDGR